MKRLLLTLSICLLASPVWAAITCDSLQSNVVEADPQEISYTPGTVGPNRGVFVALGLRQEGLTIGAGGVTYGGVAMTQYGVAAITAQNPDVLSYLYWKTGIADGAATISVDWSAACTFQCTVAAYTCYDVRQSDPFRGVATTTTAAATSVSIDVPSAIGDLVIDAMSVAALGVGETATTGADQTDIYNLGNGGDNLDSSGSTQPGATGNVTMSWSNANAEFWATVGGSLVPASTRRPIPPIIFQ